MADKEDKKATLICFTPNENIGGPVIPLFRIGDNLWLGHPLILSIHSKIFRDLHFDPSAPIVLDFNPVVITNVCKALYEKWKFTEEDLVDMMPFFLRYEFDQQISHIVNLLACSIRSFGKIAKIGHYIDHCLTWHLDGQECALDRAISLFFQEKFEVTDIENLSSNTKTYLLLEMQRRHRAFRLQDMSNWTTLVKTMEDVVTTMKGVVTVDEKYQLSEHCLKLANQLHQETRDVKVVDEWNKNNNDQVDWFTLRNDAQRFQHRIPEYQKSISEAYSSFGIAIVWDDANDDKEYDYYTCCHFADGKWKQVCDLLAEIGEKGITGNKTYYATFVVATKAQCAHPFGDECAFLYFTTK